MEEGVAAASWFGMLLFTLFGLLVVGVALLGLALWIWMLVDCLTKETDEGNSRLIWVLVIVLAQVIGAAIYYFVRYRPRKAGTLPARGGPT